MYNEHMQLESLITLRRTLRWTYCFQMTEASVERQTSKGVSILQVAFYLTVRLNSCYLQAESISLYLSLLGA